MEGSGTVLENPLSTHWRQGRYRVCPAFIPGWVQVGFTIVNTGDR